MSIGATPPANGDAMTWASEVKEAPLPFEKHLTSITNLLNSQYLDGENFWRNSNIHQINELKTLFTNVLNDYCATLLNHGNIMLLLVASILIRPNPQVRCTHVRMRFLEESSQISIFLGLMKAKRLQTTSTKV